MRCLVATAILSLLLPLQGWGEQRHFAKHDSEATIRLEYRWSDFDGEVRQLNFDLDKDSIPKELSKPRGFMPDIAQRYVYLELMKAAQKVNPKVARIRVKKRGRDIVTQVTSNQAETAEQWQTEFSRLQQQAMDKYLQEHYYNYYTAPFGEQGVKPDHVRYGNESLELLRPLAQQLYEMLPEQSSTRQYVNLVLSWVQSIPYDVLEDRLTSNGSGYLPPINLMLANRGDCDSKTVLAAALLRSLVPNLPIKLVFLSDHALLAAALPHREHEQSIAIEGQEYLLMEPTGPALLMAGQVGQESLQKISGGLFKSESF